MKYLTNSDLRFYIRLLEMRLKHANGAYNKSLSYYSSIYNPGNRDGRLYNSTIASIVAGSELLPILRCIKDCINEDEIKSIYDPSNFDYVIGELTDLAKYLSTNTIEDYSDKDGETNYHDEDQESSEHEKSISPERLKYENKILQIYSYSVERILTILKDIDKYRRKSIYKQKSGKKQCEEVDKEEKQKLDNSIRDALRQFPNVLKKG